MDNKKLKEVLREAVLEAVREKTANEFKVLNANIEGTPQAFERNHPAYDRIRIKLMELARTAEAMLSLISEMPDDNND